MELKMKHEHAILNEVMRVESSGGYLIFDILYRDIPFKIWMFIDNGRTYVDDDMLDMLYTINDINEETYDRLYSITFYDYADCVDTIKSSIDKQEKTKTFKEVIICT